MIETEAKLSDIDVKPAADPVAEAVNGTANIDNTLPTTEISVTKEWKDGTDASGGNCRNDSCYKCGCGR